MAQPTTATPQRPQDPARVALNHIAGEWLEPTDAAGALLTHNPATGRPLANVPLSGARDVRRAARAAAGALAQWRQTPPPARMRALLAFRERLEAAREELAALVTENMGKTLQDARGEVRRGIESVEHACALMVSLQGATMRSVARGVDVELFRQPVGVVAAITPFNFPAMIPLWFMPYALACGNTFILKPSERDPLPAQRLVELAAEVKAIPSGVVNLVHGGRETVDALLADPDVAAISFVGSAATARHVYRVAAEHGKRVQALGGAKNALIVMADADRQTMLDGVLSSAFGAAGQRCLAGSVAVLVGTRPQQDEALDAIASAAAALRTGDGADPRTDVCPLIGVEDRLRVEGEIERALQEGAKLVLDGRIGGGSGGSELAPTILEPHDSDARAAREELFGPVLTVIRQPDLSSAIGWVNRGRYGNAASIFTSSGAAAQTFADQIHSGMLGVNVGVAAPVAWFPFAGWKDSFAGDLHANGSDAFEFYTRKKVLTSRWR